MATLFDARLNADDTPYTADALVAALEGCDVLVSSITDRLDAELIARIPKSVRLIAQFGNGFDNVDIEAAYAAGLTVTNTPSVLTEDTADMAMMLMLALPRRLVEGAGVLPSTGTWPGWSPTWMLGRRLRGKALGIVGMGRIGSAVAARAKTFGLAIHYYSRNRRPPQLEEKLGAIYHDTLDGMLGVVDILSLHTPLTRDTSHILSRPRIGLMKPEAIVVNVSRPELIEEDALIEAILPVASSLSLMPSVLVGPDDAQRIRMGQSVFLRGRDAPVLEGTVTVSARGGALIALADVEQGALKPKRIFHL